MWPIIVSLETLLQVVAPAFTEPSFRTQCQMLLGWVMCIGRHSEFRVFETIVADEPISRKKRHPFDRFYNFFYRSAWSACEVGRGLAVHLVVALNVKGPLCLVVDDTLLHKSGRSVYGAGWFHDGAASTKKREVTAFGNNWVVVALAFRVPFSDKQFCVPLLAKLRQAGGEHPGPAKLAREMLKEIATWFPDRAFVLIGDGGYSSKLLLKDLPANVTSVGLMRGDAKLRHPTRLTPKKGKTGPKPKTKLQIDSPRDAVKKADRKKESPWTCIEVFAYGEVRKYEVLSYQALWPTVFGDRVIQVVISRDKSGSLGDVYLFTTDLAATAAWVVETYAKRVSIEGVFKDSKQVMQIEKPQHWSKSSVQKLSPWVWLMQTLVTVWYLTEGRKEPLAKQERRRLGAWDSEWSLRFMVRLLRRLTLREQNHRKSRTKAELTELITHLENYLFLAG